MNGNVLYEDEYMRIFAQSSDIFIETFKKGFPVEQLNAIFVKHPEIGITSYTTLRNAINLAPRQPQKFAELKEKIVIEISNDELTAAIVYNLPAEELEIKNREKLIKETEAALKAAGVSSGIKRELFFGEIMPGKTYIIAEGSPPIHGKDCVIRMYELEEAKPSISENGKVDFYNLKLINMVKAGDWLGERIDATDGVPGLSVKGVPIKPVKGRNFPLNYDRNSVQEVYEDGKTVLYSRINGAANYTDGKISVSNHLMIDGDVDLSTGNIKFDGYLTIKGTVVDGFSVEATRDIEINGDFGLGNVRSIISSNGSIFIKGGIASKSMSEIRAAKNIFVKFADNACITCGGTLHIGYYSINSRLSASDIIIDSSNGKIIGGHVKSEMRVIASIIGSEIEKRTIVEVAGFNRSILSETLENVANKIAGLKSEQQKLKQVLANLEGKELDQFRRKEQNDAFERLFQIREEIRILEEERKNLMGYMKIKGEGEITAAKRIYPNCTLIIKNNIIEITSITPSITYYIQDGEIKIS